LREVIHEGAAMTDFSTAERAPDTPARLVGSVRVRLVLHTVLPLAVGIAAAVVIGAEGGIPSALMVCAANYLLAAAIARPAAAWWGMAGALPLVGLGVVFDNEWLSLLALGVAQVVVFFAGLVRARWHERHNLLQVVAAAVFGVLSIAAAAGTPVVAAVTVIVGLLAHGIWDLIHHRTGTVVAPSYSAFCAGLDAALAVAVTIALVTAA
jgi:hypothetical protein